MPERRASEIEADITRLESGLRQLKVQYDMFLAGALAREPWELRRSLERLIKRYSNASIRKYQHRFHFNALVARYNCFAELWGKNLRAQEEGSRQPAAVAVGGAPGERTVARCTVTGGASDEHELRRLHARFLAARKRASGSAGKVPYDVFAGRIVAQSHALGRKSGCKHVELRVVVDEERKVRVRVRPGS